MTWRDLYSDRNWEIVVYVIRSTTKSNENKYYVVVSFGKFFLTDTLANVPSIAIRV